MWRWKGWDFERGRGHNTAPKAKLLSHHSNQSIMIDWFHPIINNYEGVRIVDVNALHRTFNQSRRAISVAPRGTLIIQVISDFSRTMMPFYVQTALCTWGYSVSSQCTAIMSRGRVWHPFAWHPFVWHPLAYHTFVWHPFVWHTFPWQPFVWHPYVRGRSRALTKNVPRYRLGVRP